MPENEDKKVSFTYPEGFIEAANSLEGFDDEESRKAFLAGFIPYIVMM
ncbi:MAG: hypothetical protein IJT62_08375 [Oscillospiraceae bacterium]|nr:hypothetical protein [Oscillospiraceae bacterium]